MILFVCLSCVFVLQLLPLTCLLFKLIVASDCLHHLFMLLFSYCAKNLSCIMDIVKSAGLARTIRTIYGSVYMHGRLSLFNVCTANFSLRFYSIWCTEIPYTVLANPTNRYTKIHHMRHFVTMHPSCQQLKHTQMCTKMHTISTHTYTKHTHMHKNVQHT
jgi:hypothetical protein